MHIHMLRVVADVGQTVGTRGETAIQIIIQPTGEIVTAYPIHWPGP